MAQQKQGAPKRSNNILIGVIALIIILLLVALLKPKSHEGSSPAPTEDASTLETDNSDAFIDNVNSYETTYPWEWDGLERAEKNIQTLGEGQMIEFSVLQDPFSEQTVYFASNSRDQEKNENLISIYSYNTKDYTFERLFKHRYGVGDYKALPDFAIPVFHVLGYDSGRLILLVQDASDSPGPCSEPLLLGAEGGRSLVSMSIKDPYSGLEPYTPTESAINEARERSTRCSAELFPNE